MPLTEEERLKIVEEEALRASIRRKEGDKSRATWGWILLLGGTLAGIVWARLFFGIALIGLITLWSTASGRKATLWLIGALLMLGLVVLFGEAGAPAGMVLLALILVGIVVGIVDLRRTARESAPSVEEPDEDDTQPER
ncbi:MAG: hypothetical protein QME79_12140 [Bacillota bacterium]|nr:hypothetical protein [Bacillota bacterium]